MKAVVKKMLLITSGPRPIHKVQYPLARELPPNWYQEQQLEQPEQQEQQQLLLEVATEIVGDCCSSSTPSFVVLAFTLF